MLQFLTGAAMGCATLYALGSLAGGFFRWARTPDHSSAAMHPTTHPTRIGHQTVVGWCDESTAKLRETRKAILRYVPAREHPWALSLCDSVGFAVRQVRQQANCRELQQQLGRLRRPQTAISR